MLSQVPNVRLGACEPRAVYARLLSRTDADRLSSGGKAHGVRLRIFKGYKRDYEVAHRRLGQVLVRGNDIVEQLPVDSEVVPSLLEGHAEHVLRLDRLGNV